MKHLTRLLNADLSRVMIIIAAAMLLCATTASGVDLQSGRVNDGAGATVGEGFKGALANATVRGYTFTGKGLLVSGSSNLLITDCVFQGLNERAIDYFGGMADVTIRRCKFLNIRADGAILGWNAVRSHVDDNVFDNCYEGFHGFWGGNRGGPDNCTILRNTFTRVQHFALEQQGNPDGLDIAFNWVDNWLPAPSQMGFSIATGGDSGTIDLNAPGMATSPRTSHRVHAHDNFIGGVNLRSANNDAFCVFELMGWDVECDHNLGIGAWNAAFLVGLNSPAAKLHDNVFCGVSGHLDKTGIAPEDRWQEIPAANLTGNKFLPLGAMQPPATADVLAGRCPWQSTGAPGPIAPAVAHPVKFSADVRGPGIVDLAFDAGDPGRSIWRKSTEGPDAPVKIADLSPDGTAAADAGPDATSGSRMLSPTWRYTWTLRDASGATLATAGLQMPASPLPDVPAQPAPATQPDLAALEAAYQALGVEIQRLKAAK